MVGLRSCDAGVMTAKTTVRVPPWSGRVAYRPTIVLHAACPPERLLDAFAVSARTRRFRVEARGDWALRAVRGIPHGSFWSEVAQLPLMIPAARIEVDASMVAPSTAGGSALCVTCVVGAREPFVSTRVSRMLDDAVRRLEGAGVQVRVDGWHASPADAGQDPAAHGDVV